MAANARELLIKRNTVGADPLVDKILSTEDSVEKALYQKALELKKSKLKAMYVEACLLATSDLEQIGEILELDPEVLAMYSLVFYQVEGLDKLSKMELLDVKDRQESLLKLWALNQGIDFLSWRLGRVSSINPTQGLKELFSTAMWKSRESLFSGNDTEASKEGLKWTKMSMDLARLIKAYSVEGDQAKKDLELALEEVAPDFAGFGGLNDAPN